ncbi:TolC family protein, partial [Vibrio parahaemolyticus]|uniref:TolC family protein n=1 Tax=Vibrio parahaemolyticus TaxID=670 RepID=UPI001A8FE0B8
AARTQLTGTLIGALGALSAADAQARQLEANVLPAAQSAFNRTRTGYEEGKFDLLNVPDTQRTLFEARRELVNARAEYEKARVQVEALIGRDL